MSALSVQEAISNSFSALSPQLRRAAQFVSEHPDEVATRSLRQIARDSQLSPPTFSRLARAIGYQSYDDLRELCRNDLLDRKSRFADKALALLESDKSKESASDSFAVRQAAASMSNIQALLETLDEEAMAQSAKALAEARHVLLIGMLSCQPVVNLLGYLSKMAAEGWSVLDDSSASLTAEIMDLREGDCALVVSMEPYASRTIQAVELVKHQGAEVIGVTDWPSSPIAELADRVFFVPTNSPQFFPSYVALLVFLESLVGLVVREKGSQAQERIAKVEEQNHRLGEYWQD